MFDSAFEELMPYDLRLYLDRYSTISQSSNRGMLTTIL